MEKLAGEPEPEEFKDNSTKKMLRKLGMLGREESPPSKRVDEVARVWMPVIFVVEMILFIIPALGSINADYAGSIEHIGLKRMSAGESPPDMRCPISHDLASFRGANRSASANAVKRCSFGMGMGQWRGLKVAFIAWCYVYVYTCFGCFPF